MVGNVKFVFIQQILKEILGVNLQPTLLLLKIKLFLFIAHYTLPRNCFITSLSIIITQNKRHTPFHRWQWSVYSRYFETRNNTYLPLRMGLFTITSQTVKQFRHEVLKSISMIVQNANSLQRVLEMLNLNFHFSGTSLFHAIPKAHPLGEYSWNILSQLFNTAI